MVHSVGQQFQVFLYSPVALPHIGAILAQVDPDGIVDGVVTTPEAASVVFSGPQFFIALLSGLILAFGFQMLLTNLSVAIGVSVLSATSGSSSDSDSGGMTRTISIGAGLWTLITVSLALFAACFLAVKMGLFTSSLLGAITGLVIWALYFTALVWISSTTVGAVIGSVVSTATTSFRAVMETATAALGAKAASSQLVSTAEATAAAVRKELLAEVDPDELQDKLRDYISDLRSPQLDLQGIQQEFDQLLVDSNLAARLADNPDSLAHIDRQTFVDLVKSRTDLSRQEANQIADQLYRSWQRTVGQNNSWQSELVQYFQSAKPEQLVSKEVGQRLDRLIEEMRQQRESGGSATAERALTTLSSVVMGRTDLSDFDAERVVDQIKSAKDQLTQQADRLAAQFSDTDRAPSIVRADVENYLATAYVWQLSPQRLRQDFRQVLHDPDADPSLVRRELEQLNRSFFYNILRPRGLMTPSELQDVTQRLDEIRRSLLQEIRSTEVDLSQKALLQQIETYLSLTPKPELFSDMGDRAFKAILEPSDTEPDLVRERLSPVSRETLLAPLSARQDMTAAEAEQLANRFEDILRRAEADAAGLQESAKVRLEQQWQQVQDYLRSTGKAELNPDGIKRDLKTLLNEPDAGIRRLRSRLVHFDRDTLVQLLSQRRDLSEAEVNDIITQVESSWYQVLNAPASLSAQAQATYDEATRTIEQYLRSTGRPELHPEGIKRDLQQLMDNPQVGAKAIRDRLSRMDRDTLVQLLSQRDDLTAAEVNQVIDQIQAVIQQILRTPQRLARRAQAQTRDFQTTLEDYLRNTEKAELHPEGIKRDVKMLLDDPRLGAERLGDRLSRFDRNTLVALLSQRDDLSEAEINQVIDQVLAARDQVKDRMVMVQQRIQSVIDRVFARLRAYLNSLDRPELSYDGIKRDIRTLFNDPQGGLDAIQTRLSRFDRNTLVALVSSHDAITESDAHQVIDQIESARDSVLHRAEQIEGQLQTRLSELQYQAQRQVEATQKAAVIAAWWLFSTALLSAISAAFAGSLAAG